MATIKYMPFGVTDLFRKNIVAKELSKTLLPTSTRILRVFMCFHFPDTLNLANFLLVLLVLEG